MPKTSIARRTWHCTGCGYEADRLVGACSTNGCAGEIYEETDPARLGSMTVIGDEDIEAEIEAIQAKRAERGQVPFTETVVNDYRAERKAQKDAAIGAMNLRKHNAAQAKDFNKRVKE